MSDLRPRRSVLYMPAANERALDKARTIPADALILDLEDAVAPDAKDAARANACAAASGEYGKREITIRCNALATPWGTNDLLKELRAEAGANREALVPHLAAALLGAREAGKVILDGVYNDVRDPDGFLAEAEQGRRLGFDGKTLIHPSQVDPANATWAPSAEAIDHAERVIAAFEEAEAEGRGVITVDGRMIENLHVDNARRVLATAQAIAELGD